MGEKVVKTPDSDRSARKQAEDVADEMTDTTGSLATRNSSNKTGKKSSTSKLAASRPDFGPSAKAKPVPGAHGNRPANQASPQKHHAEGYVAVIP